MSADHDSPPPTDRRSPAPAAELLDPRVRAMLAGRFPATAARHNAWGSLLMRSGRAASGFLGAGAILVLQLLLAGLGVESLLRTLVGPAPGGWVDVLNYLETTLCALGILLLSKLRRLLAGRGWLFAFRSRS